jgi:hypothetical protein
LAGSGACYAAASVVVCLDQRRIRDQVIAFQTGSADNDTPLMGMLRVLAVGVEQGRGTQEGRVMIPSLTNEDGNPVRQCVDNLAHHLLFISDEQKADPSLDREQHDTGEFMHKLWSQAIDEHAPIADLFRHTVTTTVRNPTNPCHWPGVTSQDQIIQTLEIGRGSNPGNQLLQLYRYSGWSNPHAEQENVRVTAISPYLFAYVERNKASTAPRLSTKVRMHKENRQSKVPWVIATMAGTYELVGFMVHIGNTMAGHWLGITDFLCFDDLQSHTRVLDCAAYLRYKHAAAMFLYELHQASGIPHQHTIEPATHARDRPHRTSLL